MTVLIKNCMMNGKKTDVFISGGMIAEVLPDIGDTADEVIEAKGMTLSYGFLDMHCHLRDPGLTHKEDISSGLNSAAKGGFTSVMSMPNTFPSADSEEIIRYEIEKAEKLGGTRVYPVGAVTKGLLGLERSDYMRLSEAGAAAFSDDGNPVSDCELMRQALAEIRSAGSLMISHCETKSLNLGGKVTPESEETMIERDCQAALDLGVRVHIAHVSTRAGVDIIRHYKNKNAPVTAETCPHYFSFSEKDIDGSNFKMNPPLRTEDDRLGIIEGLADGTIDVISTDHAPHTEEEKSAPYEKAPNGIIGFETAFSAGYTNLVKAGHLPLEALLDKMAVRPYKISGVPGGKVAPGERADLVLLDLGEDYEYKKGGILSKSKNSPFIGKTLSGRVKCTICRGRIIYRDR